MTVRVLVAVLLGLACVLVRALPWASIVGAGVERPLARGLLVTFLVALVAAAVPLATAARGPGAWPRRARLLAAAAAAAWAALAAGFGGMLRLAPPEARSLSLRLTDAYGPLTFWPRADVALPPLGIVLDVGLGRLLVLVASALLAGLVVLALVARRASGACPLARPLAPVGLAGLVLPSTCPGCMPVAAGLLLAAAVPAAHPATAIGAALDLLPAFALLGALVLVAPRRAPWPAPARAGAAGLALVVLVLLAPVAAALGLPSGAGPRQDAIHGLFVLALMGAVVLTGLTLALAVGLALRYRDRGDGAEARDWAHPPGRRRALGAAFVIVPTLVVFSIGVVSYAVLLELESAPEGTLRIDVVGMQFAWQFTYPDGSKAFHELRVEQGHVVVLNVTSPDVIHSLFIPDMGVKMDANPGGVTETWFRATRPGSYPIVCAEFCGAGHSEMRGTLVVFPAGAEPRPYGPSDGP